MFLLSNFPWSKQKNGPGQIGALLLCLLANGFATPGDWFAQGNAAYDKGDFTEAVRLYRTAIREEQFEVFAWFNLGNSLVKLDRPGLASVAYRRSAELAPQFVRPWVLLGDLHFVHGELGAAIAHYRRALELGEDGEHIHFALGEAYLRVGSFTDAERHLETLVRRNPDRIDGWFAMAEIQERLGDLERAVELLGEALRLSPQAGAQAYFYLAHLHSRRDSVRLAIVAMEDGLMLETKNSEARRHLAQMYLDIDSPWMALFTLEAGLGAPPGERREILVDMGQIYFGQARYGEALQHFREAWRLGSPTGRLGAENVAIKYQNAGQTALADSVRADLRMVRSTQ